MRQVWQDVGDRFGELGRRLREHIDIEKPEGGPSEGRDVQDALRQFGDALTRALEGLGEAVRDPAVKEDAKRAARTLADAVTASMEEVGEEVRRRLNPGDRSDGEGPPPTTTP